MIMQLSDQGRLDLSDPLTRHIPVFSIKPPLGFPAGGPITIRSILTHHSGIPGDINNGVMTMAPDPDFNTKLAAYLQVNPDLLLAGGVSHSEAHDMDLLELEGELDLLRYLRDQLESLQQLKICS
ncbi:MAG: serine hydrolase domain-containing protein, partial [Thermodesulfobacteriota bacterium]